MTDENSEDLAGNRTPAAWPVKASMIAGAVVIAALTVSPFFVGIAPTASGRALTLRLLPTHDLNEHMVVMEQFDKSIRSGVLYPRWLAEINNEYGNAWTNFYPPVSYYLTSAIHAVVGDWVATVFVLCVIVMAASGLAFYILSRAFYGQLASIVAASLYLLLPYHVLDLYWRGALSELVGFVYLPLVIYFAFKLGNKGRLIDYAGLGLTYGLYVMTHLPVGYLMSYVLVVYAIVWAFREKNKIILLRIGAGMALGLLVSAIYLLPAIVEARYAYESTSLIFPYDGSYLPAVPPRDTFGDTLNHSFMLQALALTISLFVLGAMRGEGESKLSALSRVRLWALFGVLTTLMVTSLSFYVSRLIPRTDLVAFPWRWLAIAGLFTSLVIAAAIDSLFGNPVLRTRRLSYGAAILLIACANVWFSAQRVIGGTLGTTGAQPSPRLIEANYTPRGATPPQDLPDTPRVVIEPAGGAAEILRWDPQYREVHVNVKEPSRVRLKTYNFPGWVARLDDKPAPMLGDKDGVQVVEVPPGVHVIEALFENTSPRVAGVLLSGLGLLTVLGLTALDRVKETKRVADIAEQNARRVGSLKLAAVTSTILIGAVIFFWLGSRGRTGRPPAGVPSRASGSVTQGSEVTLHIDGIPSILVAVDEQALIELMQALPARDNPKVDALVQSGQLLRVPNDTHVRILEYGGGKIKIRILEGEDLMAEGWVPERWVR